VAFLSQKDYYEILGISREATKDELKSAYRKLALQYHPDRNKSPEAEDKFKEISEAYAVLSDDEKKKTYDQYGRAGIGDRYAPEDIFKGVNFEEIFRDLGFGDSGFGVFDQFFGRRGWEGRTPQRGYDLQYDFDIDLEEAARGLEREITIPRVDDCRTCGGSGAKPGTSPKTCPLCRGSGQIRRRQSTGPGFFTVMQITTCDKCRGKGQIIETPCTECKGTGNVRRSRRLKVRIPRGVDDGSTLRLRGEGDSGPGGVPPGDLYVTVHVRPHPVFERKGEDLLCEIPISFAQATLGSKILVPSLDEQIELKIPPGTQSGTHFKIKGKGMPRMDAPGRGDEYVRANVKVPTRLTRKQRDLLIEFEKEGEEMNQQSEST
jgi:molecular chaperone DnaJ